MFHDRQEFDMGESEIADIRDQAFGERQSQSSGRPSASRHQDAGLNFIN